VKNASLILNIVLAIAVAVLYYLHFKGNSTDATPTAVPTESKGKAIVYVNVDSLLTKYDFFQRHTESIGKQTFST